MKTMIMMMVFLLVSMCVGCMSTGPYEKFLSEAQTNVESNGPVEVQENNALVCWATPVHDAERDILVTEILAITRDGGEGSDVWKIQGHEYDLTNEKWLRMSMNDGGILCEEDGVLRIISYGTRFDFGTNEDGLLTIERFQAGDSTGVYICNTSQKPPVPSGE